MRSFCHTCHDTRHPPEDRSITKKIELHRRITEREIATKAIKRYRERGGERETGERGMEEG